MLKSLHLKFDLFQYKRPVCTIPKSDLHLLVSVPIILKKAFSKTTLETILLDTYIKIYDKSKRSFTLALPLIKPRYRWKENF